MIQQLQVPIPPTYPKETTVSLTPESLIDKSLYQLIDDYGLKPILDRLATIIGEECVTLRPDQSEQMRTFIELASEEID